MSTPISLSFRYRSMRWVRPSYQQWWLILLWPLAALLLAGAGWAYLQGKHDRLRAEVDQIAKKEVSGLATAYAVQLAHTVEQLDQNLLNLKYLYENVPGSVNLRKQVAKGMYPMADQIYVSIFDAEGRIIDSTVGAVRDISLATQEFFQVHAENRGAGLAITKHSNMPGVARPIVRFSRRLDTAQGEFAGVVSIAVEPQLLGSFYDQTAIGRGDFVTVRTTSGKILSTKMGESIRSYTGIFRKPPVFDTPAGVARYPKIQFNDNESRIYAWSTLAKYPLISTVGLLESDIYAEFNRKLRDDFTVATAIAIGLCLFSVAGMVFTHFYLERRHQAEASRRSYHLAIEGGQEGFFSLRAVHGANSGVSDFFIDECNTRGAKMLGRERADMLSSTLSQFCGPDNWPKVLTIFSNALETGFYEDQFRFVDTSQHISWLHRRLVRSGSGLALTLRDVTESKEHEAELYRLANCDALTGLYNRHWLMRFLPRALERSGQEKTLLALLFIDLDNFKEVNNSLGHNAGDQLLSLAAVRFRSIVRPKDHVVRLGGDEFTIILEDVCRDEIVNIADRIIGAFSEPFQLGNMKVDTVRASIGIAICPEDGTTIDTLVHHADSAMYVAKEAGKGIYRFHASAASEKLD